MRNKPAAPNRATDIHSENCKQCSQKKHQLAVSKLPAYALTVISVFCLTAVFMQNGHITINLKLKDMIEIQTEIDKPLVELRIKPKCLP